MLPRPLKSVSRISPTPLPHRPSKGPLTHQILYVWGPLSPPKCTKKAKHKELFGGLRGPKILYAEILRVPYFQKKNPRAHKNKIGTPPKYPPPLKEGILWTWVFFLQKERIFQVSIKLAQPFPAPRIADKNFMDTRIFLIFARDLLRAQSVPCPLPGPRRYNQVRICQAGRARRQNPVRVRLAPSDPICVWDLDFRLHRANGRGRFGGQTAAGHPKPFLGPKILSAQCRHWESLKVLAGLVFVRDAVTVPAVCFLGTFGGPQRGQQQSATQTLRVHLLSIDFGQCRTPP